jgi:cell division protein FtsW
MMAFQTLLPSNLYRLVAPDPTQRTETLYDVSIVVLSLALMTLGFIMVSSASMPVAERLHADPLHFTIRHCIYLGCSILAALIVMRIPMDWWRATNPYLLLLALLLLVAVLLVGRTVNGSTRWLAIGPITIQVAEPAKLFFFCYLSGYLVRRYEQVTENLIGFVKPMAVFFLLACLLLAQPDMGTVVVMFATTVGVLFLVGARLWQFFALGVAGLLAFVVLIYGSEYRKERIISFLDPWQDPFGTGYQLTQSLMAFGRGDLLGQGLGKSLQKLAYLPEAHTDFIVAILAEEIGFLGVSALIILMMALVFKALKLGNLALKHQRPFEGYLAYSIGIWFSLQTAVNVGAAAGVLPTKGLTFPFVSYGGSSLLVMVISVALLVRIGYEIRIDGVQTKESIRKKNTKISSRNRTELASEVGAL